jgi:hypothetical protein
MFDASPDTPPPIALRAGELLRQRGVPYEDAHDTADGLASEDVCPRESGVFPVSVRAATHLAFAKGDYVGDVGDEAESVPVSEPPRSLAADNLARVLEALRART